MNPPNKYETTKVLNISNTTASGLVVLNDQRLLEIIQQYPFLYNPSVNPQNDEDYDEWAWISITKQFNTSYLPIRINFTPQDIKSRWQTLQPLVISLNSTMKIGMVPDGLRAIISAIGTEMLNAPKPVEFTPAQKFLISNTHFVERLPLEERKKLEADIMELIIDTELKAKGNVKLGPTELQEVEEEYDDFLKAIRLKELFILATDDEPQPAENQAANTNDLANAQKHVNKLDSINTSNDSYDVTMANATIEDDLLQPIPQIFSVPLNQAHLYIRPCRVRVKRTNVEDLMPLSMFKMKREKPW